MSLLDLFSARELAALLWGLVALAWVAGKPKIRQSLVILALSFFHPKILSPIVLLCAYTGAIVWGLHRVQLWDLSLVKDTVLWTVGAGIVTLLSAGTSKDTSAGFRAVAAEIFTVAVVIEFLANLYSFPLWVELLALPLLILAALLRTLAEYRADAQILKKPLDWFIALYGLTVLSVSVYGIATHVGDFLSVETAQAFLLPLLLSAAALPYFYVFLLLIQYETVFLRLRWTIRDPALCSFAKRRLFRKFHLRLGALQKWQSAFGLRSAATKSEFLALLNQSPPKPPPPTCLALRRAWQPRGCRRPTSDPETPPGHARKPPPNLPDASEDFRTSPRVGGCQARLGVGECLGAEAISSHGVAIDGCGWALATPPLILSRQGDRKWRPDPPPPLP